jgi:hypothetical protein
MNWRANVFNAWQYFGLETLVYVSCLTHGPDR